MFLPITLRVECSIGWLLNKENASIGKTLVLFAARHGRVLCVGIPVPDISFVDSIPELQVMKIGSDWFAAVATAETALDVPRASPKTATGHKVAKLKLK